MAIEKTRTDIVDFALTLIGVKAADEDAQDSDVALATEGLDDLVKSYQATGSHLWNRRSFTLFLKAAQIKYTIGPQSQKLSSGNAVNQNNVDHATESYTASTLASAVSTSASIITLTDTNITITCDDDSDILIGDFIALLTSSGWWWSTVKAITLPANIQLSTTIPEDLAAGVVVNWYTDNLGKALRVPDARRQQGFAPISSEIEMEQMGRSDYLNLPNKNTSGTPVQFYYNPLIDDGEMFIWPAPTANDQYINGTYYRPIDVFDDADSAADFPNEWVAALKYNLAVHMAPAYGGREISQSVMLRAQELYNTAYSWDQGDAPSYFTFGKGRGFG